MIAGNYLKLFEIAILFDLSFQKFGLYILCTVYIKYKLWWLLTKEHHILSTHTHTRKQTGHANTVFKEIKFFHFLLLNWAFGDWHNTFESVSYIEDWNGTRGFLDFFCLLDTLPIQAGCTKLIMHRILSLSQSSVIVWNILLENKFSKLSHDCYDELYDNS